MKHLSIGIDIGGTNLRGGLVDHDGRILDRFRIPSDIAAGAESFIGRLSAEIDTLIRAAETAKMPVSGIGIGIPGLIGNDGTVYSSVNMKPLDGVCLTKDVEQRSGIATICANDASMAAVGEHRFGAGSGLSSFIVITIGTGLGSGLILDSRLWTGAGGFAAEFGHLTIVEDGYPCPCGNRGCLEQYVSAPALVRAMQVRCSAAGRILPEGLDAASLADMARCGDDDAKAVFARAGEQLGMALASIDNLLDLQGAVVCGGVATSLDLMEKRIMATVAARSFPQISGTFRLLRGTLGDDAGLLGAAALARSRFS